MSGLENLTTTVLPASLLGGSLAAGIACWFRRYAWPPWIVVAALVVGTATAAANVFARDAVDAGRAPLSITWLGVGGDPPERGATQHPSPPLDVRLAFRLDGGAAVLLLGVLPACLVLVNAAASAFEEHRAATVVTLTLVSAFLATALCCATNLLAAFACWQALAVVVYVLGSRASGRTPAAVSARKILLVHSTLDAFLLTALIALWFEFGTLETAELFGPDGRVVNGLADGDATAEEAARRLGLVNVVGLGLFVSALGRCGLFPLFGWLRDAGRLPTCVSGIVVAAVVLPTGIVFLLRCAPLFAQADAIRPLVVFLGLATAVLSAAVALTQIEFGQSLAFAGSSVVSVGVLGVVGRSTPAPGAAVVLLAAYALLASLAWSAVSNVAVATGGPTSLSDVHGLRHRTPLAAATFLVTAVLVASCGWGQQAVLEGLEAPGAAAPAEPFPEAPVSRQALFASPSLAAPVARLVLPFAAFLLATALGRAGFLVFFNGEEQPANVGRESSPDARTRAGLVVALAAFGGLTYAAMLPATGERIASAAGLRASSDTTVFTFGTGSLAAAAGFVLAWSLYARPSSLPKRISEGLGPFARLSRHRFYVDDFFFLFLVLPLRGVGQLCRFFDWFVLDGLLVDLPGHVFRLVTRWTQPLRDAPLRTSIVATLLALAVLTLLLTR